MSVEKVRNYLAGFGLADRVAEFDVSSATVELAAQAVGVIPAQIAKTLSFHRGEGCMLLVMAGDAKVDNKKFKQTFGCKARMLTPEEALEMTGHAVGGVCPFALPQGVEVYTDISMQRFPVVYPAAGSASSAVKLSCDELFFAGKALQWVDVCKGWQQERGDEQHGSKD